MEIGVSMNDDMESNIASTVHTKKKKVKKLKKKKTDTSMIL